MIKTIVGITGAAAFVAALGIVGTVERGGSISALLWCVPLFVLMTICSELYGATGRGKTRRNGK